MESKKRTWDIYVCTKCEKKKSNPYLKGISGWYCKKCWYKMRKDKMI